MRPPTDLRRVAMCCSLRERHRSWAHASRSTSSAWCSSCCAPMSIVATYWDEWRSYSGWCAPQLTAAPLRRLHSAPHSAVLRMTGYPLHALLTPV
jgi:hypothetical protein